MAHHPTAQVYLDDEEWEFILPHCPHCGHEHTHSAGVPGDDPREFLGHRVAHCDPSIVRDAWALGYYLVLPIEMSA